MISLIVKLLIAFPSLGALFQRIRIEHTKEIGRKNYDGYLACLKRLESDK